MNGGGKNYLEYVYDQPKFLATCVYGIPFICLGNMAGNAINFGENTMIACGSGTPSNGAVRGIAVGVATAACLLHIVSRTCGIALNNTFGSIKATMLLMLIVVGICSFAGAFPVKTKGDASRNYEDHGKFISPPGGSYGYATSFLSIIFAYGGFNQANYILGNIMRPRRRFKATALITVGLVSMLYICLNLCYYGVVPYNRLIDGESSIVVNYFTRTLTRTHGRQVVAAFISFSSLGNIIIQTFTAARVKQELAKEGILPCSKFFARNRLWRWRFWRQANANDFESPEATPVGALLLHWAFSMALILGTFGLSPMAAYQTYVILYSFTIDALFGFLVGLGLLILRISDMKKHPDKKTRWSDISRENKYVSIGSAGIFTLANLYPMVAIWFPPGKNEASSTLVSFWVTGTVSFAMVLVGLIYWLGFRYVAPWWLEADLHRDRSYITGDEGGELVVINEIVAIGWQGWETRT